MTEGKSLVIVESPGKIDKIKKALGSDYKVMASIGHIRDLDESGLSIDLANGFKPEYVIPAEKKKVVADLKQYFKTGEKPYQSKLNAFRYSIDVKDTVAKDQTIG
mgnify:CR=1 FL=1